MSKFSRGLRQSLTVARRDLVAIVMTPTFLLFLLSPLLMIGFGVVGSLSASTAASAGAERQRIIIIAPPERAGVIASVDRQLRSVFTSRAARPDLRIDAPSRDLPHQAEALFDERGIDVAAILYGPLERPQILRTPGAETEASYLAQIAEQVLRAERSGAAAQPLSQAEINIFGHGEATPSGRGQTAYFAALGIFFLTLMLSGQAVGAMAEERANKVIEVLAAAIPLESVFFGKLLGTFGSALLFVGFWGTLIANLPRILPPGASGAMAELGTATGPIFPLLFVAYFAMAYLLQSAVFLGLGAQAGTQREIQMLSLPITIFQFGMLGLGSYAAGRPESWITTVAEIFPFSSPLAMVARAANGPELWPHLLALAWQALWVGITVSIAARLFRRGVLKSGNPPFWKRKRPAIDTSVN